MNTQWFQMNTNETQGAGNKHLAALNISSDSRANLTTPSQLFHILRRQALRDFRKPLVILTPKSLLRHPRVVSTIDDFTKGRFLPVIDDQLEDKMSVTRVVFCTGKIFYELLEAREQNGISNIRIYRVLILFYYYFVYIHVDDIQNNSSNA